MSEYTLAYNYEQWANLMETLGKARPSKDMLEGFAIFTTVELDGISEEVDIEKKQEICIPPCEKCEIEKE